MSVSNAERAKFEAVFIVIRDELIDYFKAQSMPNDVVDWFQRVRFFSHPIPGVTQKLIKTTES